jgi:hypothetical protein
MNRSEDPFITLAAGSLADDLAAGPAPGSGFTAPAVGRLLGFDLLDQPLVAKLKACQGQVLVARSTMPLRQAMIGREVLVVFDGGDTQAPVIVGVLEPQGLREQSAVVESVESVEPGVTVLADGERHVITAEREIVLRCGDASITLTRAGRVIIKGRHILSRSAGYNKIKGAAIDIN